MLLQFLRKPKFTTISAANFHITTSLRRQSTQPLTKPALQSLIHSQYRNGKFKSLLKYAVASPPLLLTACHNLSATQSLSNLSTSLQDLSFHLSNNSFDVESCCFNSKSLVLPNLKLKIVIEAVRIVLEVIYDDKFAPFSYGGRANVGRHTAVRYLRHSVENPVWWFSVSFDDKCEFDAKHVDRLCCVLGEKIDDSKLIDLIRRLFECGVVKIELGGVGLGRGFPQECGLSSILINVYLNGFDREVQEIRLNVDSENPKFKEGELVSGSSDPDIVFYKPLKVYAVRYLDEILIITSGTKEFTLGLKNRVVNFLENLELKVDKVKTVLHSTTSEMIKFMGMELRAVAPSVLHRVKSEKAIRACKKYQRQKEVRLIELKNAKERNRRKLGMKLLNHAFKKVQASSGFKFDFQIENEVRQIFSTWGDEVVQEYLNSVDDRWEWHQNLTSGDFLSLKRIRDQLPKELIDAHDNFQRQVDRYLNPAKAKMVLEEEVRRKEEEEKQKFAKKTVDDLTKRSIKVDAPLELIRKAVRLVGFTNSMGRPRPIGLLTVLEDADIIKWYAGVATRWLEFYSCCNNIQKVKIIVSYHLRFSCILTLAEKHEATKIETIRHFTMDLKVPGFNGAEETYFPSEREIRMMRGKNLSDPDPKPVDGALTMALTRLAVDEGIHQCIAHFCDRTDTVLYRIQLLQKHLNVNPSDEQKWVHGMGSIHDSLHRNCVPLCSNHVSEFYMGRLTLQDIDCTLLVDVDN